MKKLFTANCIFILVLLGMQAIAGNVDTIQIQSNYLKKATKFVVIQPSIKSNQGLQNKTQERYPVVYLLHAMAAITHNGVQLHHN
jgi:nitrate reductase gamma subunit